MDSNNLPVKPMVLRALETRRNFVVDPIKLTQVRRNLFGSGSSDEIQRMYEEHNIRKRNEINEKYGGFDIIRDGNEEN